MWQHIKQQTNSQLLPIHSHFPFVGSLSYIPGTSERITRWLHRKGFRVITTPCTNLFQSLRTDKPIPTSCLRQSGIYCIPVSLPDGSSSSYIGSTIRCLEQRIKEHQRSCRDRNVYSALAQSTMAGGSPLWNEASILGNARSTAILRWKEALFICAQQTINSPSLQLNSTIIRATGFLDSIQPNTVSTSSNASFQQNSTTNHGINHQRNTPFTSGVVLAE